MKFNTKIIAQTAIIAALYTALTLASAPLSYGLIQFRISEALCLLPLFCSSSVIGLTLGCFLSNLVGLGLSLTGPIDLVVGTGATLLAVLVVRFIGVSFLKKNESYDNPQAKKIWLYILAPLPVIIFNAVIVGIELTYIFKQQFTFEIISINMAFVAIGETTVCYILGTIMLFFLFKNNSYKKILL